jgi:hypothetical protein
LAFHAFCPSLRFILGYKRIKPKHSFRTFSRFYIPGHYKFWLRWNECVQYRWRKKNNDTVEDVEYEEITTNISCFLICTTSEKI